MDLSTTYLGMRLPHPLIVGAGPLGDDVDRVRALEDAGASMLVLRSLYEEEITGEQMDRTTNYTVDTGQGPYAVEMHGPIQGAHLRQGQKVAFWGHGRNFQSSRPRGARSAAGRRHAHGVRPGQRARYGPGGARCRPPTVGRSPDRAS